MDDLDVERQRSRELLLNVLPARIVARLDAGETHIADRHEHVAVLMTDLVGFTPSAAQLSAADLVGELNDLFTRFDEACAARGVEKIKTIGDAYMAVAGLDRDAAGNSDESVAAAAHLALDMFDALAASRSALADAHRHPRRARRRRHHRQPQVRVRRVGRHGQRRQPARVDVAAGSHPGLAAGRGRAGWHASRLEPRGLVELKGKGEMPTWFVTGRL